ncbi:hypothetical protein KGQ20_42705 [Catenulispora sp. NF23]|uniref:Uncharacterized protein n=1 Tax=Catenulispora pinistramenti TaxID=2705254 RepID=A0ABS5KII2_9ACTN|nr:hypothetical protein [Catenulispora pinistramenti]MBS2539476.1 hypothetical protein [Catenulispora pinistramenti]MBS2546197.1 hypothetical protein [Catenulispora pinistramenti]
MTITTRDVEYVHATAEACNNARSTSSRGTESAYEVDEILALEPSMLPSHPLRADDVTCFLPKLIG